MRHLVHMATFLAVSMVVQTLYLLADLYWVGHLGKEAIVGVGVAGNLMMIVLALTQALGVGTTTLISHAAGQKDQPRAELVFNQSFTMSILVGLALGVCGFAVRTVYCDSLSADAITAELAKKYLLWFIPSPALQFPLVVLGSALRATRSDQAGSWFSGPERSAQYCSRTVAHFRNRTMAEARRDRRGPGDLYLDSDRRYSDCGLLREKISLPAFSSAAFATANQDLAQNAGDRRSGRFGVCAPVCLYRGRLRDHPRLWTGGASRFRRGRTSDASALPAGGSIKLRRWAGRRSNFGGRRADRVRQSVYAALGIASAMMFILTLIAYLVPSALIRVFSQDRASLRLAEII
jgi:hypothetical protein